MDRAGARTGPASVTLWALAWITFFVPLAVAVNRRWRGYPEQGASTHIPPRRFGPATVSSGGWYLWVNNLFYFPSVLLFGAAQLRADGRRPAWRRERARWYSVVFVLTGIWVAAGVNIIGLHWASGSRGRRAARRVDPRGPAGSDAARLRVRAIRISDPVHAPHDGVRAATSSTLTAGGDVLWFSGSRSRRSSARDPRSGADRFRAASS